MKTQNIVTETRLIRDANERLPVNERSESKVKGLYRAAASEVENDRTYNPEKYMYMSDDEMAELVKNKFDEKMAELPGMTPDKKEKPEDVQLAEDEFATEMDNAANETPENVELGNETIGNTVEEPTKEGSVEDMFNVEEPAEEGKGEEPAEEGNVADMFNVEPEESEEESEEKPEETAADNLNKG